MLKTCKWTRFDPCSSLLPATNADRWSPNFQRVAVIASSKRIPGNGGQQKARLAMKAIVSKSIISEAQTNVGGDLVSLAPHVSEVAIVLFRPAVKRKSWRQKVEMFIERVIVDCRLFALIAVAGSLLGAGLCFIKGCFHILETYFQYFRTLSHGLDQGRTVRLLIEALDMYVVGTVMLSIGIGLYVMFVGSRDTNNGKGWLFPGFQLKGPPTWMQMKSVLQGKLKIGQAVVKILQVDLVEKLLDVPVATGLDLACLAGTVVFCSATVFLLSRLSTNGSGWKNTRRDIPKITEGRILEGT